MKSWRKEQELERKVKQLERDETGGKKRKVGRKGSKRKEYLPADG